MLTENTNPLAVPQKDLDNLRAEMARTMLNVTKRTVLGLEKLSIRLEGIDDALAQKINLDEATPAQLLQYFNQVRDSYRLKQDFLKTLAGYDVDTSKVAVEKTEEAEATVLSEDESGSDEHSCLVQRPVRHLLASRHLGVTGGCACGGLV